MANHQADLGVLAARAATGDSEAFRALVSHTTPTAYRLACRILRNEAEAQDVLQDTYVRVWQRLPGLRNPEVVASWIYRICRNAALDRARAGGRRKSVNIEDLGLVDETPGPESRVAAAQDSAFLGEALGKLREKHRLVIVMREIDGMACDEIAEALGVPVGTVDSRLHRARKALATAVQRARKRDDGGET